MIEQHIEESLLIELAMDVLDPSSAREATEHLASCLACREQVESFRHFLHEVENPAVWQSTEPSFPGNRVDATVIGDLALRLEAESSVARDAYARGGQLESTAGGVQHLLSVIREAYDRDPREALAVAEKACTLADSLDHSYPAVLVAELRATARREQANALRLLGRFGEALRSLELAEQLVAGSASSGFQRACIAYVRATVQWLMQRHDEALRTAKACADQFLIYGDSRREAHARILVGGILFEKGETRSARELFYEQVQPLKSSGDLRNLALLYNNIAHASVVLDDREIAANYFLQALRLFDELSYDTMKGHVQWGLGRLRLAAGQASEALERFEDAERMFDRLGMKSQAALVGLEAVELRIARGENDGIAERCRNLIERFRGAGLPANADAALAYLQEAVRNSRIEIADIRHVRTYLEKLDTAPHLLFAPPPDFS